MLLLAAVVFILGVALIFPTSLGKEEVALRSMLNHFEFKKTSPKLTQLGK
jgi:hypothetical protein